MEFSFVPFLSPKITFHFFFHKPAHVFFPKARNFPLISLPPRFPNDSHHQNSFFRLPARAVYSISPSYSKLPTSPLRKAIEKFRCFFPRYLFFFLTLTSFGPRISPLPGHPSSNRLLPEPFLSQLTSVRLASPPFSLACPKRLCMNASLFSSKARALPCPRSST